MSNFREGWKGHLWQGRFASYVLDEIHLVNKDWTQFLSESIAAKMRGRLQKHERTGRPAGNIQFIEKLEKSLGLTLKLKEPGRKPKK
jgi:putative transposase